MYRRILVVVADHPSSRVAIEQGIGLAQALAAELLFVHVLHPYVVAVTDMPPIVTLAPDDFARDAARLADRLLADALAAAQRAGVGALAEKIDAGDDADGIVERVRQRDCDLIVIGAEGGNALVRLLTGSPVSGLITRAAVPVMVCHAHDSQPCRRAGAAAGTASASPAASAPPSHEQTTDG